jgi:tetratricopeptide (TPR) repeat protein
MAPLAALLVVVGTATAQQRSGQCRGLRYGSMRLNSAKVYLDVATDKQRTDPVLFRSKLRSAQAQLDTALRNGGEDAMTLAFFYGEVGILSGDLVGADSMFTKAEATASEDCLREIVRQRRNAWAPFNNGAINMTRAGNPDSTLVLLRKGNVIYRGDPSGALRMVSIFAQRSQTDSAIFYALQAAHSTGEARFLDLRKAALFTAGRLQQGANRAADAEATFREYLRLAPRDLPAMGALGAVLALQNRTADANVVYDSLMVFADTITDSDVLFDAATELVRARRYPLAARLYERELTLNRCHRDALYNLASTYNAMQDSVHMLAIARRLAEIDPMNRGSLAMLAQAYVFRRDTASIGTLQRLQGLPWDFEFAGFTPAGDTSVTLGGAISNLQERPLPAFRLTIEFLNGACEPVSSAVVEVPEVPANGRSTVEATGRGRGIKAFRYSTN